MNDLRTAAQQALEALERYQVKRQDFDRFADEVAALRAALAEDALQRFTDVNQELQAALAEPVQEPVAAANLRHTLTEVGYELGMMFKPQRPAEPVQEPVAWMHTDAYNPKNRHLEWSENRRGYLGDWIKTPLYAAPPRRKPLTEEEIYGMYSEPSSDAEMVEFARAIERAHGIAP